MARRHVDNSANDEADDETGHDDENGAIVDDLANNQKKYECLHRGCTKRYKSMSS